MPVLPYTLVKPHDPAACPQCGPRAPGHQACLNPNCPGRGENGGAGRAATRQTRRHATAEEYGRLPLALTPLDGTCHQAVFACDECAEDCGLHEPFCAHPEPTLPACPVCAAGADQPCLKKDGVTALGFTHAARPGLVHDRCTHAHRADCPVFDACRCTGDDQPPPRPPHPATLVGDGNGPDVSRLLFDPAYAQALLAEQGIHWWQVRRADSRLTQDNKPCMWAEVAQLDDAGHIRFDEHGHEVLREVVIVLEAPQDVKP